MVRPSFLDTVWGVAGFTLGVITAAVGSKAAMARTIAVEEAIVEHYQKEAENLGSDEASLQVQLSDTAMKNYNIAILHSFIKGAKYDTAKCCIR